jgi:hypothetical protein
VKSEYCTVLTTIELLEVRTPINTPILAGAQVARKPRYPQWGRWRPEFRGSGNYPTLPNSPRESSHLITLFFRLHLRGVRRVAPFSELRSPADRGFQVPTFQSP